METNGERDRRLARERCLRHRKFKTQEDAEREMSKAALSFMLKPRGSTTMFALRVFPCGNHWHFGRDAEARRAMGR